MERAQVRFILRYIADEGAVSIKRGLDKSACRMERRWGAFVEDVLVPRGPALKTGRDCCGNAASSALNSASTSRNSAALAAAHCKTTLVSGCLIHSSIWRRVVIGKRPPSRGRQRKCSVPRRG